MLLQRATDAAYKAATAEYEADIRANSGSKRKRGDGGAAAIAEKQNAALPDGATRLTADTIRVRVSAGRAGQSAPRRGPERQLPEELFASIATFIQMKQEAGDEQKPKDLKRVIKAALKGTTFEEFAQSDKQMQHLMGRVREDFADEISRANKVRDGFAQHATVTRARA